MLLALYFLLKKYGANNMRFKAHLTKQVHFSVQIIHFLSV